MTVEKMILLGLVSVSLLLGNSACRKNAVATNENEATDTIQVMNSRDAALMNETGRIIEEVYLDNLAYDEANAAIQSGYYYDERVLLKDLLFPYETQLYNSGIFKKHGIDTGQFRKRFCEILLKGSYPLLLQELGHALTGGSKKNSLVAQNESMLPSNIGVLSATDPIAIYFPYSENFPFFPLASQLPSDNKIAILKKPTLVVSDRDADVGTGRDPYYCLGAVGNTCYKQVYVNDDYAVANPTHIITTGGVRKASVAAEVPKTELVHRVYHGASRLTRQMDRLISFTGNGGGSEIKVCRINGYLRRSDEQIDDFSGDVVTLYYTRGEIRKKLWKRVYSIWDPNWNYQDIEQIYAVYEEDTKGTRTIDGSLKTSLTIPGKVGEVEGDIGFKIQASTQDEIITQRKLDRKSFLRDGGNNQGWAFYADAADFLPTNKDWPIFDGGAIWSYTLPFRIY